MPGDIQFKTSQFRLPLPGVSVHLAVFTSAAARQKQLLPERGRAGASDDLKCVEANVRLSDAMIMQRIAILLAGLTVGALAAADYPVQPVLFTEVSITGGFWKPKQEINRAVTVPYALQQCEETKRIQNFELAAETLRRRAAGEKLFQNKPLTIYPFDDSDVFKAVEGAAFALSLRKDPALEARLDGYIAHMAAAQEPDGYLYTFRTMHPDSPAHDWVDRQRWLKDPILSHELYNLGHLYEAGVAHFQATGKTNLLDICLKSANLVDRDFGQGELRIAPGHQVIEMGLAKLYRVTGDQRYLKLARFFLDVRGPGKDAYNQRHLRVVDQTNAVGHAVRANYMYAGMADVAALTGDLKYQMAITKIWDNVVGKKLHLTGGVGARAAGEAYGDDYELPNNCYNETCAAIAFLMWNHRMFLLTGEARYMDVFERTLYNGFPSGVSLAGDRFFYPNPLEYDGKAVNNHGHAGRAPWFGCACCPPNVLRTLAALTGYFYAVRDDRLYVNLYAQSEARATVLGRAVKLSQSTDYPWSGVIKLTVAPVQPSTFALCLRIPGWVQGNPVPSALYTYENSAPSRWSVKVGRTRVPAELVQGFLVIRRTWKAGDVVTIDFPMPVRRVRGHVAIKATEGRVALERGPVVYCLEGVDNEGAVSDAVLPPQAVVKPLHRKDVLGGATLLQISGAQRVVRREDGQLVDRTVPLTAIPYHLWNNRGLSPMQVWLPRTPEKARVRPVASLAGSSKVSVSFHRPGMDPASINDQVMPLNATDGFAPNFNWWPHKGTLEWAQLDFARPAPVSEATVIWFDDTGSGECRVPASWRVLYQTAGGGWSPVGGVATYPVEKGQPIRVAFTPVTTSALRLEVQLPPGFSAGLYEWSVR
jgi:DUF1680 family protein